MIQLAVFKHRYMGLVQILGGIVSGYNYTCLMLNQLKEFDLPHREDGEDYYDVLNSDHMHNHNLYLGYAMTARELDRFITSGIAELKNIAEQIREFEKPILESYTLSGNSQINYDVLQSELDEDVQQNLEEMSDVSDKIKLLQSILDK
uniref:Uncharacterized protein n=1 Tax=viral metagenome TaxID=1070528 RepID=A0A6C0CC01_9ZZZZ